ncbi:MAG: peptide chain release factor 2 [Patescibacteria group bacterium]
MATLGSLKETVGELQASIKAAYKTIDGEKLTSEHVALKSEMDSKDFWADNQRAAEVSKQFAKLESRLAPWLSLLRRIDDLIQLADLSDDSMAKELEKEIEDIKKSFDGLKSELKLSGKYDDHDAIVSIHSGAVGTDAQDWAEMLERMYLRWAEKSKLKVDVIDRTVGDEAGIKSVNLTFNGPFAFGKLKGEHGVHRLVRLSPFNADSLRQTSFAKVDVTPKIDSPSEVIVDEKELKIDVYRSGWKGGQSVNTTDSAVRITHLPTNIVVAIQNERSQLQNRETAMTILRSKLAQLQLEQHAESLAQLKGPNEQAAWGNQIRSYVLHPYKMVKDLRTNFETSNVDAVLAGDIDGFIDAYLEFSLGK